MHFQFESTTTTSHHSCGCDFQVNVFSYNSKQFHKKIHQKYIRLFKCVIYS